MRGDIKQTEYKDRTHSELVEQQKMYGFDLIKTVKYINIIVGTALIAIVILDFITLGFIDVFSFVLTCYQRLFGIIIIASSFGAKCIRRNFLFLMTGLGRGFFNFFVGTSLFMSGDPGKTITANFFLGWAMVTSGLIFLFLSRYKRLSDEDINRAVSIQKKSVINSVSDMARRNQNSIKQAAWENREVVA